MYFYVQVIKSKTYKKKCQLDELKAKKSKSKCGATKAAYFKVIYGIVSNI